MNQEIKNQAREDFERYFIRCSRGEETIRDEESDILSFIDSLIDRTVQMTEERIVGIIQGHKEIYTEDTDYAEEGEVKWHMDSEGNEVMDEIISLITNNSDINK